jgi:hypothetical protein
MSIAGFLIVNYPGTQLPSKAVGSYSSLLFFNKGCRYNPRGSDLTVSTVAPINWSRKISAQHPRRMLGLQLLLPLRLLSTAYHCEYGVTHNFLGHKTGHRRAAGFPTAKNPSS